MTALIHDLSTFTASLREGNKSIYPASTRWVMVANGDADLNDNVIFFGFEQKKLDPILVAKAPRVPQNDWMLKIEYDRLTELWKLLGQTAESYLPKPVAFKQFGNQSVLILSYLHGESLTRISRGTLWKDMSYTSALAVKVAHSLRVLDDGTARRLEVDDPILRDFASKAKRFQELFALSEKESQGLAELLDFANRRYAAATHKVLIQGDFWHGNLIQEPNHDELKFVDWQFARWSVDVSLDVYFFIMTGAFTVVRRQGEENLAKAVAAQLSAWRSDLIPAYLNAYGHPENFVLLPLRYGMLSCCVEKAIRSEVEFGYKHPDDLMWRNLFTELLDWSRDD